jgi:hypothetical protein
MSEPTIRPPAPHGASPDGPVGGAEAPFAFEHGPDWQNAALDVVRKYPIPCVLGAAALGFWIGRNRGQAIAAAAAGLATNAVLKQLSRALETTDF